MAMSASPELLTQCLVEETTESPGRSNEVSYATKSTLRSGTGEHGKPAKLLKTLLLGRVKRFV